MCKVKLCIPCAKQAFKGRVVRFAGPILCFLLFQALVGYIIKVRLALQYRNVFFFLSYVADNRDEQVGGFDLIGHISYQEINLVF